jgi:predicted phage tail protein
MNMMDSPDHEISISLASSKSNNAAEEELKEEVSVSEHEAESDKKNITAKVPSPGKQQVKIFKMINGAIIEQTEETSPVDYSVPEDGSKEDEKRKSFQLKI